MAKTKENKMKEKTIVETPKTEEKISTRGKTFEGTVIKMFQKRLAIQFERTIYNAKYERYSKSRTKVHARIPAELENQIKIGDLIQVQECRPLSKIIHFMVIKIIKSGEQK